MKKVLNILCVIAITVGIASCKKEEEVKTPKDTTGLIGKWVKVDGNSNLDSLSAEGPHLDTIKVIEFFDEGKAKVSRGEFCNFGTKKDKGQDGSYEYYSVNNSTVGGTSDRIKFDKCNKGMPAVLQGNTLRFGYGNEAGAFEEYIKVVPKDTTEVPETPEIPTEPGTGGE